MSRLACWAVVAVGLFSGAWCLAQDLELFPQVGVEVVQERRVVVPNRDLIATPETPPGGTPVTPTGPGTSAPGTAAPYSDEGQYGTVSGRIIILAEESELGGLERGPATSEYRSSPSSPLLAANAQRQALIQSLQTLQDTYCRNAQLDEALTVREMIRKLQAQAEQASSLPEPVVTPPAGAVESPDAYDLRGQNGKSFYRQVTGTTGEYVWGGENNIYTDDSLLSSAAVHAGVLKAGETAMVRFTVLPGKDSYDGSTRNGVTTRPWESFGGSFSIDGAGQELTTVYDLRGQDKPPFTVYVVGSQSGTVYGTNSYTDDSDIATAAVHVGLLKVGEAGFVMVTLEGGKSAYEASIYNGVTTYSYGSWGGGFRLSAFRSAKVSVKEILRRPGFQLDVF